MHLMKVAFIKKKKNDININLSTENIYNLNILLRIFKYYFQNKIITDNIIFLKEIPILKILHHYFKKLI